jgi:hypothetical protein
VRGEFPSLGSATGVRRTTQTAGKLLDRMSVERETYDQDHLRELLVSSAESRNSASDGPGSLAPEIRSPNEEWGTSASVTAQE